MKEEKYTLASKKQIRKLKEFGIVLREGATQHTATGVLNWVIVARQQLAVGNTFYLDRKYREWIDWRESAGRIKDEALPCFDGTLKNPFHDWMNSEKERMRQAYQDAVAERFSKVNPAPPPTAPVPNYPAQSSEP